MKAKLTDRFMGCKIPIPGTPYQLVKLDDLNWTLQRLYTIPPVNAKTGRVNASAGTDAIENVFYYPTLGMACADVARYLADEHEAEAATLFEYAEILKRIGSEIEDAVNAVTSEGKYLK